MLDLRAYRIGFAPALAALVVLAFSLDGVPEPLVPVSGTTAFDAESAADRSQAIVRVAPDRRPGSEGAAAAADLVARDLEAVASGSVSEQLFTASVDGDDAELRNLILTLPGADDRAIVVIAGRASRSGTGAASSAAATGMLLELASALGVSGHERTLIFASIDGAAAEAEGAGKLIEALPDETAIDGAIVVSQPGAASLVKPHLVTSSGGRDRPSLELIRTGEELLETRAGVDAGLDGVLGQIFRQALPAAAGTQAALLSSGVDAVAISAAGEVPLPAPEAEDRPEPASLERLGAAAIALVGALDASAGAPGGGPSTYVRLGGNSLPGWTIAMLALVLLLPPALPVGLALAQARRRGTGREALGLMLEWVLVALTPLLALYGLALAGLIPAPDVPFDPGRFGIGPFEVIALLVLAGSAVAAWWALGLRRATAGSDPAAVSAAAGAVCITAGFAAWLANPALALLMAPLAHLVVLRGATPQRAAGLAIPLALVALVPLGAALIHLATALDWGATIPWQLVVLVAGGGIGVVSAAALAAALAGVLVIVGSCLSGRPQPVSRGRP